MSDPSTIEILSSSDEEGEEKKSEAEEVKLRSDLRGCRSGGAGGGGGSKMGNCIGRGGGGGDAAIKTKRKRPPSPTSPSSEGSPPQRRNPPREQPSAAAQRPLSPTRACSSPEVEYVPSGGAGVERVHGSPPHRRRKGGEAISGNGQVVTGRTDGRQEAAKAKAKAAAEAAERRREAAEKPIMPLYAASSSSTSSSSSSASSSSSSFFSSINCSSSNRAVRAPPPKNGGDKASSSTAATLGSFSNCPSSVAVKGGASPTARPRRHSAKETRPLTIDLTGLCGDDYDEDQIVEEATVEKGKQSGGGKKRHKFSEAAGYTAVAAGVELAIGDEKDAINGGEKKRHKVDSVMAVGGPDFGATAYEEEDEIDIAVVTEGIMGLIDEIDIPNAATCTRPPFFPPANPNDDSSSVASFPRHSPHLPLHYQQRDKWSCGFRNMQMVLSALLPRMRADHPFFSVTAGQGCEPHKRRRGSGGGSGGVDRSVPSLYRLQTYLERSWAEGFDPRGARHFGHRIRGRTGKSSWIGAVEVSSLLTYFGVDSAVVQFIQRPESRALLGDFVRSYFERKVGYDGCYTCCSCGTPATGTTPVLSNTQIASELLQFAAMRRSAGDRYTDVAVDCCRCPVPPLYLQWEGHSVTVVGCLERKGCSNFGVGVQGGSYDLLIFDPMKSGSAIQKKIEAVKLENATNSIQHASGNGTDFSLSRLQGVIVLSTADLIRRDCQIVLSSPRPLNKTERSKYRAKVSALTAADDEN